MSARKRREARAAVDWRGGVHIAGTPLFCDAVRTREACFVSSALVAGARRHRQIIATRDTVELLGPPARRGRVAPRALAVPTGRPFALGDVRVELFPSGLTIGAASLLVEVGGRRVVYAGAVQPRAGRVAAAAEVRAADAVVIDATLARWRFRPDAEVLAELDAWLAATRAAGATPVVLAPVALGPDLLRRVGAARAHPAHVTFVRRLRALGVELPAAAPLAGAPPAGEVVLWTPAARDAAALAAVPRPRLAFVSGWAADPAARARLRADAAFAFPEAAGAGELETYLAATGATTVYLLGAGAAELGRALAERGVIARRLGPPEQLRLPI